MKPCSLASRPIALASIVVMALTAASVSAFCGLQSCPRPSGSGEPAWLEAGLRTRWVAYDIAGNEGSYLVSAPRLFVRRAGFAVGAEAPFTRLQNGSGIATGLSNPVVMAQYARRLSSAWSAEAGLQWELPLGDQDNGLSGDHMMLLPWIGARRDFSPSWHAAAQFGYSRALGGEHRSAAPATPKMAAAKAAHDGHDHGGGASPPVLVNPHADREAQWRAMAGWTRGRGTIEGFALGQIDVTDAGPAAYARAGASWEWALTRFTAVQVLADLPVTSARRNEVEIGLTLRTGL